MRLGYLGRPCGHRSRRVKYMWRVSLWRPRSYSSNRQAPRRPRAAACRSFRFTPCGWRRTCSYAELARASGFVIVCVCDYVGCGISQRVFQSVVTYCTGHVEGGVGYDMRARRRRVSLLGAGLEWQLLDNQRIHGRQCAVRAAQLARRANLHVAVSLSLSQNHVK